MGLAQITEPMLAKAAGWEAMKSARQYLQSGAVLSAEWKAPQASGLIQAGSNQYRAGLVFDSEIDIDNLCTCRESRQYGTLCAHSVAIALATLHPESVRSASADTPSQANSKSAKASAPSEEPVETPAAPPWFRQSAKAGQTLKLRLILAPNSVRQFHPKTVSVMLEGSDGGAFKPLNQLDRDRAYQMEPPEIRLLPFLQQQSQETPTPTLSLDGAAFCELLDLAQGSDRLMLGRSKTIEIRDTPWLPSINVEVKPEGALTITAQMQEAPEGWFVGSSVYIWIHDQFCPVGLPPSFMAALQGPLDIPRPQVPIFLHQIEQLDTEDDRIEMNVGLDAFEIIQIPPRIRLHMEGGLARLDARLEAVYPGQTFPLSRGRSSSECCSPDPDHALRYLLRDMACEQAALDRLMRAGFEPDAAGARWRMKGQDAVLGFLAGPYAQWTREWEVTLDERLDGSFDRHIDHLEPKVSVAASSGDWFDFKVSYQTTDGDQLPREEIQRLLRSGKSYQRKPNGKYLMLDPDALEEFDQALVDSNPQQHQGTFRVRKSQSAYLENTFRANQWEVQQSKSRRDDDQTKEADVLQEMHRTLPKLKDQLRPYQWQGVLWIDQLFRRGFAGILADEMGLGKTLQILTWIRWRTQSMPDDRRQPFLVICPSSLVFNWAAEAEKWTPELKVLTLEGAGRSKKFGAMAGHDLVITSYALIRRDLEHYQRHTWSALLLDEAQHIKNRATQNARSVKAIRADHRLVLTGTPMENSVLDLWSVFDFLMPGYLGSAKDFKERYEVPVTQETTPAVLDRLQRRVGPFLLRRTKEEVRPDLPERIDQVSYCTLSPEQRSLYQQIMETGRAKLLEVAGQKQGSGQARMMVLSAILRMRQICCDARLVDADNTSFKQPSSKLDLFVELLDEALDGGHRILVFSQFVQMLSILRETLEARETEYCYLDGSTTKRGQVVQRFQNSTIPVFLISLKAGGTGLNLTGADTVIHFDPWWNPAVEAQATARAHRIGQTKTVTSYKLVARDTIEEKILKLQHSKQAQLDAMLESGKVGKMDALNWDDITALFA